MKLDKFQDPVKHPQLKRVQSIEQFLDRLNVVHDLHESKELVLELPNQQFHEPLHIRLRY